MFGGVLEAQKTQRAHRVAGVDRLADAVGAPQRRPAVTQFVAVFDVVVDQRVVVKYLDRDGGIERAFRRRAFAGGDAHHHLRAQPLAAPRRPVPAVAEVAQKHIGDLPRSPIVDEPFLEGFLESLKQVDG